MPGDTNTEEAAQQPASLALRAKQYQGEIERVVREVIEDFAYRLEHEPGPPDKLLTAERAYEYEL